MLQIEDLTDIVVEIEEVVGEFRAESTPVCQPGPAMLARLRADAVESSGFWDKAETVKVSRHGVYGRIIARTRSL